MADAMEYAAQHIATLNDEFGRFVTNYGSVPRDGKVFVEWAELARKHGKRSQILTIPFSLWVYDKLHEIDETRRANIFRVVSEKLTRDLSADKEQCLTRLERSCACIRGELFLFFGKKIFQPKFHNKIYDCFQSIPDLTLRRFCEETYAQSAKDRDKRLSRVVFGNINAKHIADAVAALETKEEESEVRPEDRDNDQLGDESKDPMSKTDIRDFAYPTLSLQHVDPDKSVQCLLPNNIITGKQSHAKDSDTKGPHNPATGTPCNKIHLSPIDAQNCVKMGNVHETIIVKVVLIKSEDNDDDGKLPSLPKSNAVGHGDTKASRRVHVDTGRAAEVIPTHEDKIDVGRQDKFGSTQTNKVDGTLGDKVYGAGKDKDKDRPAIKRNADDSFNNGAGVLVKKPRIDESIHQVSGGVSRYSPSSRSNCDYSWTNTYVGSQDKANDTHGNTLVGTHKDKVNSADKLVVVPALKTKFNNLVGDSAKRLAKNPNSDDSMRKKTSYKTTTKGDDVSRLAHGKSEQTNDQPEPPYSDEMSIDTTNPAELPPIDQLLFRGRRVRQKMDNATREQSVARQEEAKRQRVLDSKKRERDAAWANYRQSARAIDSNERAQLEHSKAQFRAAVAMEQRVEECEASLEEIGVKRRRIEDSINSRDEKIQKLIESMAEIEEAMDGFPG
ncbi:hypothetical protein GGR57DRAFT_508820 [Xylariaceae sp. FL1272]|nr:hypothetical protein GGR57DRAFT_508820 [Xylariaceae sp. FL1272]